MRLCELAAFPGFVEGIVLLEIVEQNGCLFCPVIFPFMGHTTEFCCKLKLLFYIMTYSLFHHIPKMQVQSLSGHLGSAFGQLLQ